VYGEGVNASALSLWEKAGGEGFRGKSLEIARVKETPRVKEAQQWDGLTGE